jgi:hypothetical protein
MSNKPLLEPRVTMDRKKLLEVLESTLIDASQQGLEAAVHHRKLLVRLAQVELPEEFELGLLESSVTAQNASRKLCQIAVKLLNELNPDAVARLPRLPAMVSMEEQLANLADFRARYDAAVEHSQAAATIEWPTGAPSDDSA